MNCIVAANRPEKETKNFQDFEYCGYPPTLDRRIKRGRVKK
jgi:hypothetical protein